MKKRSSKKAPPLFKPLDIPESIEFLKEKFKTSRSGKVGLYLSGGRLHVVTWDKETEHTVTSTSDYKNGIQLKKRLILSYDDYVLSEYNKMQDQIEELLYRKQLLLEYATLKFE